MATQKATTKRAEQKLITAAPKVSDALTAVRDYIRDPMTGYVPEQLRSARDDLYQAAASMTAALEKLHELNA